VKIVLIFLFLILVVSPCWAEKFLFDAYAKKGLPAELSEFSTPKKIYPPISSQGDMLVDKSGVPIKLWGGNLRLTKQLLNLDIKDKHKLLNNIHQMGFNQLRIVGPDFDDPGIYTDWVENGEFPARKMGALCEITEYAKDLGMVYSIDINHITKKYSHVSEDKNLLGNKNKPFKYVQIFDQVIIAQTEKWYREFFQEKHPGCSDSYGTDEYLFYVNVVNEDSLFDAYNDGFKNLSDDNVDQLSSLYRQFLNANSSSDTENFDVSAKKLCTSGLVGANKGECKDTVDFIFSLEDQYFSRIINVIRQSGFQGLVTTTNNWYGPFNRVINLQYSDALNTHIYFSPVRYQSLLGAKRQAVKNFSFIRDPLTYNGWDESMLYRLPAISQKGKPIIISEWNHGYWSDYSYEGPLLLLGVAMQQDVSVMTVHSLLDRYQGYEGRLARTAYPVFSNPILYAMLPSLSSAFIGRDYQVEDGVLFTKYVNKVGSSDQWSHGKEPLSSEDKKTLPLFFANKYRWTDEKIPTVVKENGKAAAPVLEWHDSGQKMEVRGKNFVSIIGVAKEPTIMFRGLKVSFESPGAVIITTMDGLSLDATKKVLLTTVSTFHQGDDVTTLGLGGGQYNILKTYGDGPQYLERHPVIIDARHLNGKNISVRPLFGGGSGKAELINKSKIFAVGLQNTPWYILEFE
jgi:hypothetical protein